MSTIYTHAVVGLGLTRLLTNRSMPWAYWGLAAVLPIIPDFDAFSTHAYGSPLGHRGITHSLLFSLALSVIAACATFRYFRVSWWRLTVVFFVVAASHGLFDALTWGGMEIPFFWPIEGRWGNWGPIPASNIGWEIPGLKFNQSFACELCWIWLPVGMLVGFVTSCRLLKKYSKNLSPTPEEDCHPFDP
jgi:inner membrane protein